MRTDLSHLLSILTGQDALKSAVQTDIKAFVILDDIFPCLLSAFRIAEYNAYLEAIPNSAVYSTGAAISLLDQKMSFDQALQEYIGQYPHLKSRVFELQPDEAIQADLAYTVFINNAFKFIELLEKNSIPFIFTLYPGGGFQLNDAVSDAKLKRVFSSPNFRKVIVTQQVSYNYLLTNKFCEPEKIELIYGFVAPSNQFEEVPRKRKAYKFDKSTFDICFVAHKYMSRGQDKGYDLLIDVAKILAAKNSDIAFHVVGGFDETDIDISTIKDKIRFYGLQKTSFFHMFYSEMDIILSPNRASVLQPGSFDGFPTGCCTEAGLCGVAVFCTDPLNQNIAFEDQKEIVLITDNAWEISEAINNYYRQPASLLKLMQQGQAAFKKTFGLTNQMKARFKIIQSHLSPESEFLSS